MPSNGLYDSLHACILNQLKFCFFTRVGNETCLYFTHHSYVSLVWSLLETWWQAQPRRVLCEGLACVNWRGPLCQKPPPANAEKHIDNENANDIAKLIWLFDVAL